MDVPLLQNGSRYLIFSIAMGAKYLSYVKSIATFALTFYGYIITVRASSDFGLSGHGPMAFLAPTFWTASCFGLSVLGLRLFGLWSV